MNKPYSIAAVIVLGAVALTGCASSDATAPVANEPTVPAAGQLATDCDAFGTASDDWVDDFNALGAALYTDSFGSWPEDVPAAQAASDEFGQRLTALRDDAQSGEAELLYDQALDYLDRADSVIDEQTEFFAAKNGWDNIWMTLTDLDKMCAAI